MPNWLRVILRRNPRPASLLRDRNSPGPAVALLATLIGTTLLAGVLISVTGQRPAAADGRALLREAGIQAAGAAVQIPALPPASDYPDAVLSMGAVQSPRAPRAASRSTQRLPLHQWVLPYHGAFTSGFGYRWGRLHAGIDLAGPYGDPIVAATDGCITYAGPESGYGEVMKIQDWDGTQTWYGHMSAFVRTSGCVHAGDLIARVGAAGDATGPHLHFEVRVAGIPIDPVPFLAQRGISV